MVSNAFVFFLPVQECTSENKVASGAAICVVSFVPRSWSVHHSQGRQRQEETGPLQDQSVGEPEHRNFLEISCAVDSKQRTYNVVTYAILTCIDVVLADSSVLWWLYCTAVISTRLVYVQHGR